MEGVTEGRIVHVRYGDQCRPAIIVKVWNADTGYVNAVVFTDGSNDRYIFGEGYSDLSKWETSIQPGDKDRDWHWPQECTNHK